MMQRVSGFLTLGIVSVLAGSLVLGCGRSASAQFGGYQQMQLDKIRQQQAADARQLGRGGPVQGGVVTQPSRPGITKNFFISPFAPYGYYNRFGWDGPFAPGFAPGYGYYNGWPQMSYYPAFAPAPIFVQPHVQIQPVIVQPQGPQAAANIAAMPNANPAPRRVAAEDEILRRVSVLRASNEAGRTRADNLIADGDREFAAQQYRRAASKYREAIGRAPDYAAGHLRAGHAYTATGDYELAVTYFAMGFELARTSDRGGFSLEALYRGNRLAKEEHMESLADAILRQPAEGGLLFLTGLALHYDGKPLQARDYFRRAAEMPGRHRPYAALFLPAPAEHADAAGDGPPPRPRANP